MAQTEVLVGWQDYLAIILRRRLHFVLPCILIVVVSLFVGMFMPRIYRAETIILVQEPNIMNPLIQGLAISTPVGARLATLREEILSWTSLSRLVHELKLDREATTPLSFERLIKQLQKEIKVGMRGTSLILISYEHQSPKLAQELVSTISTIFLDRHIEAQTAETGTAIDFLDEERHVYKKKLEDSERTLREFREMYASQMPVATQLNEQIVQLEVQLAQLLVENTDAHPTVVQIKERITDLKHTRNEEIKRFVASAVAHGQDPTVYESLLTTIDQPTQQIDGVDPGQAQAAQKAYAAWVSRLDNPTAPQGAGSQVQVMSDPQGAGTRLEILGASPTSVSLAPWQEQELSRLTRDYQVNASTYQHLQERLERANITQRLGDSDEGLKFKILEPARLPLKPVKPNMFRIGLFAFFLGAFVGSAVAFVAEYLDQSFQSAEEVQAALSLPVLGTISTIITDQDLDERRQRLKRWMSVKHQLVNARQYVLHPLQQHLGQRLDALLVRWKL